MTERTEITAELSRRLGWQSAAFMDACRDVAAVMGAGAHLEHIGSAPMLDTSSHCAVALAVVILASEGDSEALQRLNAARQFIETAEAEAEEMGERDYSMLAAFVQV